jgi:hypothetical protein
MISSKPAEEMSIQYITCASMSFLSEPAEASNGEAMTIYPK